MKKKMILLTDLENDFRPRVLISVDSIESVTEDSGQLVIKTQNNAYKTRALTLSEFMEDNYGLFDFMDLSDLSEYSQD